MNAVSSRISGGSGESRWPIRCWWATSTSKLPTSTMRAVCPDGLTAAGELAGLHVALHDVDAVLLVEGDAGDLVEADDVVLGDEAALPGRVVDEHAGDGRLAAGDEVGVRRDLLEQVRLAGAARAELDHVEVALDERHHAQQQDVLLPLGQLLRLEPHRAEQQVLPLLGRESRPPLGQSSQRVAGRELDRAERPDREGLAVVLVRDDRVVVRGRPRHRSRPSACARCRARRRRRCARP